VTLRTVRKAVDALLKDVTLFAPFDATAFCRDIAARRGQPIYLKAVDTVALGLPSGIVFELEDASVILYDGTTSPYHQTGIILHEIGHLVADHYAGSLVSDTAAERLFPEIGRHQARRRAAREAYSAEEEQEAEYFARRVLDEVSRFPGPKAGDRLKDTFDG
jgi:hypothetical protein